MAVARLDNAKTTVDTGNDSIVIVEYLEGVPGGRTLDVTGFTSPVIQAGHIVIVETATKERKPMPVTDAAYAALPAGHSYEGVVVASVLTEKPMAGIMLRGSVNEVASPYPVTDAMKAALPLIRFTQD